MAHTATLPLHKSYSDTSGPMRFEALDSWRGICALLVAAFHFPLAGPISQNALVRGSFLFVDFFFVLSGFVFAHAYGARLARGEGFGRFLITRFGRLAPLHLFMLLVLFTLEIVRWYIPQLGNGQDVFTGRNTLEGLAASIFMAHSFGLTDQLTWNTPSWSISAEMVAYIIFGAMVVFVQGYRQIVAAGIFVVSGLVLFLYSPTFIEATYDLGVIRCFFGFSFGMLVYALHRKAAASGSTALPNHIHWTLIELLVVAAVIFFVIGHNSDVFNLLAPLMFGATILVFARQFGFVSRILQARPLVYIGAISYSIYLTHMTVQAILFAMARFAHNKFGWQDLTKLEIVGSKDFVYSAAENLALVMLMVGLTIAASALTYRVIERPSREWFRQFAARSALLNA